VNNKITWVNFIHIYQPPWQQRGVVEQVTSESYEYLFKLFERYRRFRCTLNTTGSLLEQLEEFRPDLIKELQKKVKRGQLELTGSAKYHALLPLLTDREIKRQIELNQKTLAKYFELKDITGFYLPEMAYSRRVAKIVKDFGFKWLILDPINYKGQLENDILYLVDGLGLKVIFRDRDISKSYPAEIIFKKLQADYKDQTIISATDGEIYGHFHNDWQGHLEKVLEDNRVDVLSVKDYLVRLKKEKKIILRDGSWESKESELKKNIPYALWSHPQNKIHKLLWDLVELASTLVYKYRSDKNFIWSRRHLDKGLSSCTFWWASATKPSDFSPLTWNPDMIDNGSEELIRAVRSLDQATSKEKIKAEKLYIEIKKNTWVDHWRKYNKNNINS